MERWLVPLAAASVFAVILVRRFRRSFGRQRWRPAGLVFVCALMTLVAGAVLLFARPPAAPTFAGGAAGGVLALVALRRSRFGVDADGRFYVPDGVIGLIVLLLFFGRVVTRLATASDTFAHGPGTWSASPLTMATLFLLLVYYIVFYGGVLFRGIRLGAAVE